MGNTSSANLSGAATLDSFIGELSDITFEKTLNSSRFLKCVRGRHVDGQVIVKLFVKSPNLNLGDASQQMQAEKVVLMGINNTLSYQKLIETDRAVYLIRQYIFSNLYDRISTRPFLESIEKRWIVYQLLTGLRDCHARNIHHGDIKTENVLVTSWNWVFLTDFAFFKPTYLPENNPADFSYFFDTSFRRTCYLAPERFHSPSVSRTGPVTDAMDIFSLGCVIAELFLEGAPLFDLSQLLRYKTGEYDPSVLVDRIDDIEIRSLVSHMICLDPDKRYSAATYLTKWQRRAFPNYFSTFLHQYVSLITDPQRHHYSNPSADIDDELDRVFFEFDKISFFLGFDDNEQFSDKSDGAKSMISLSIPNYRPAIIPAYKRASGEDGALIFLNILLSGIRNTTRAATRVRTCDTILALSERISDEAKLDRVVPFLVSMLTDDAPEVRCSALRSLTHVLASVTVLTPVNAFVFPEYILPKLRAYTLDPNILVRITYASTIASIISTAARYLHMAHALKTEGFLTLVDANESDPQPFEDGSFTMLFDTGKKDQRNLIHEQIVTLLTDSEAVVKRTLLYSIPDLCNFFGRPQANDVLLGHLITYLNDKDWLLKAALFKNIFALSEFLGTESVEEYILPLLVQSLTDTEDFVVEHVLTALTTLCKHDLIRPPIASSLITVIVRFLAHPNLWIQEASTGFLVAATQKLSRVEIHCIVAPQIKPFLRTDLAHITDVSILQTLRRPLPALILEHAFIWAAKATKSLFWQSATRQRDYSGDFSVIDSSKPVLSPLPALSSTHYKESTKFSPHRTSIAKSSEDEQYLTKLRNNGLKAEDEWKLIALREYIWRVAHLKLELQKMASMSTSNAPFSAVPTTVFFEQKPVSDPTSRTKFKHAAHDVQSVLRDANLALDSGRGPRPFRRIASPIVHASVSPRDAPRDRVKAPAIDGTDTDTAHLALQRLVINDPMSSRASSVNGDPKPIGSRSSSVNLPGMSSKAQAEVATTNTIAMGQVDHHSGIDEHMTKEEPKRVPRSINHTYTGSDVNILNLLDKVYLDNFRGIAEDLGRKIQPTLPKPLSATDTKTFRPENVLVAHIHEHSAAINQVIVSPDHIFFVTCSDDGTIKVWDSSKLERNVANRSRISYRGLMGQKIKTICFLEDSYTIAAGSDSGAIQIITIDCSSTLTSTAKYGSMHAVRKYQLPENESAIQMHHFTHDQSSILLISTNKSRIIALDVRTMTIKYTLDNPAHHGSITSFCIDKKKNWLVLGTSRGILDLWDLRFKLRLKSIGLPQSERINRLHLHPNKGRGRWVCVASGKVGEITVWDLEKSQCREVYRPLSSEQPDNRYIPWDVEECTPENMLTRFAGELASTDTQAVRGPEVRALAVAIDADEKHHSAFMVSASTDQKIRFWDLHKFEQSTIICGKEDDEKSSYTSTVSGNLTIHAESEKQARKTKKHDREQLLRNHMDVVLDVAILRWPYHMIISVDRSGVLKVTA